MRWLPPFLLFALALGCKPAPGDVRRGGVELVYRVEDSAGSGVSQGSLSALLGRRLERLEYASADVVPQGDRLRVAVPKAGEKDVELIDAVLKARGHLEFRPVEDGEPLQRLVEKLSPELGAALVTGQFTDLQAENEEHAARIAEALEQAGLPDGMTVGIEPAGHVDRPRVHLLKPGPPLSGHILTAAVATDEYMGGNRPYVLVELDAQGARTFEELTGELVQKRLAIVVDGKVHASPVVQTKIPGGRIQITLATTSFEAMHMEARKLAAVLSAKEELPVSLVLEGERVVPRRSLLQGLLD